MDISKLRVRDILNPKKWVDFAQGEYYEKKIGFHICEQIVYYSIDAFDVPVLNEPLSRVDWNTFKEEFGEGRGLSFLKVNEEPEDYDIVENRIPKQFTDLNVTLGYAEQVVLRSITCQPCLKNGSCKHCGCTMPSSFMAPLNECSSENEMGVPKWTKMLPDPIWKIHRKLFNIKLGITYASS